jgi:hypothetical protein
MRMIIGAIEKVGDAILPGRHPEKAAHKISPGPFLSRVKRVFNNTLLFESGGVVGVVLRLARKGIKILMFLARIE